VSGVEIAPGRYDYFRQSLTLQTDPSARLSGRFESSVGGYFDGDLQTWRVSIQATPDPRLAVNADYTINRSRPTCSASRRAWRPILGCSS
jgi:hypothetical protein